VLTDVSLFSSMISKATMGLSVNSNSMYSSIICGDNVCGKMFPIFTVRQCVGSKIHDWISSRTEKQSTARRQEPTGTLSALARTLDETQQAPSG
jgi:hypothetical protein